jgi:hypothetical protein
MAVKLCTWCGLVHLQAERKSCARGSILAKCGDNRSSAMVGGGAAVSVKLSADLYLNANDCCATESQQSTSNLEVHVDVKFVFDWFATGVACGLSFSAAPSRTSSRSFASPPAPASFTATQLQSAQSRAVSTQHVQS